MKYDSLTETVLADLTIVTGRWRMPVLLSLFGPPGAGKTTIAAQLAAQYPLLLLTTDALRLKYGFHSGPDTLAVMFQLANELLPQQIGIIFDGIHMRRQNRIEIRRLAERHDAFHAFVYATASTSDIERRLQERLANPAETVAAGKFVITAEHYERIVYYLEPPDQVEDDVFTVNTSQGQVDDQLSELYRQLRARVR